MTETDQIYVQEDGAVDAHPLKRWQRTARLVRMFCGVCIALRKYVIEAGLMNNYVIAVRRRKSQTDDSDQEIEEISFCLKNFQMKKEISVPQVLIYAMEKAADRRTDSEIQAISHLMRNVSSFRNYTRDMQLEMSKIVRYQKCEKGRVVLRKGHIGYSVYFIYSGSVSVILDSDEENTYARKPKVVLRKGACFGEIALLRDTRRNATIICAEECEFLVIDKDDFIESGLHLMVEEEFNNRFNFFRNWPPFKDLPNDVIHHMTSISRTEYFNYNKVVIRDSQQNDSLWFVVEGSCDVLRLVDLQVSPNYNRLMKLLASDPHQYLVNRPRSTVRPREKTMSVQRPSTRKKTDRTSVTFSDSEVNQQVTVTELQRTQRTTGQNGEQLRYGIIKPNSETAPQYKIKSTETPTTTPGDNQMSESTIFVRVDTLREGLCFGLGEFFACDDSIDPCRYSLISKACTVIHISRNKLREILDANTISQMEPLVKEYPSDLVLCDRFLRKSEWNSYKQKVVSTVLSERQKVIYQNIVHGSPSRSRTKYNSDVNNKGMTSYPRANPICLNEDRVSRAPFSPAKSANGVHSASPWSEHNHQPISDTRTATSRPHPCSQLGRHRAWLTRLQTYTDHKTPSSLELPSLTSAQTKSSPKCTRPVSAYGDTPATPAQRTRPRSQMS